MKKKPAGKDLIKIGLRTVWVLLGTMTVGCGPTDSRGTPSFQVRDSTGIEIVESAGPVWREGEAWRVGPAPLLRIGVVEGDPAQQFSGITGAVRLPSGVVVVADGGSQEVRFFGQGGEFLGRVGGAGGGPGEFTGLSGLGGDGAGEGWAYDFFLRRITWMNGSGEVTGLTSLGMEPAMLNPVGSLPDGTFVLKQLWGAEEVSEASRGGLRRDPIAVVRVGRDGVQMDTLGLFPGREIYLFDEGGRGVMGTPPFARNAVVALREGRVVVGEQRSFEFGEYGAEGELRRLVRVSEADRSVGPQEMEWFLQGRLAHAPPEDHAAIRRSVEEMPRPETMPAYGGVLGDSDGNLWVSEWAMGPQLPSLWRVFGSEGSWLGTVEMPRRFFPLDIGSDWMLGVQQDDLDVEYLVLFPLQKG